MLQRIQSLYLFIAICLNAAIFSLDLAQIKVGELYNNFNIFGLTDADTGVQVYSSISLVLLCLLSMFVSLVIIFMFKKRQLQVKLSQLNLFIQLGFVAAIFFMVEASVASYTNASELVVEYTAGAFLAIVPIVFIYLAIRTIKKDEALVRAADRIR